MIDKQTREKLLLEAGILVDKLRQEDTHGGALALIASSPFDDSEAADYLINAIIATGTAETLALAYELPLAAAQVLHSKAVANVTMKKRPGKTNGVSAITEVLKGMFGDKPTSKPDEECQCAGCRLGKALAEMDVEGNLARDPDGTMTAAFEFGAKSPEEAKAINERFMAEVAKGRNPIEVAKELGGRLANPADIERAVKAGRATVQHLDASGNPINTH